MPNQDVALLNAGSFLRRGTETVIRGAHKFPAIAAAESNRVQTHFAGGDQSLKDVWRVAAGRDSNGDVAAMSEGFDLARKDLVEPIIVSDGSDGRSINRQCQCRQRRPVEGKSPNEFGGDMLSIGGAAPVAEQQQLMTGSKRFNQNLAHTRDRRDCFRAVQQALLGAY